MTSAFTSRTKLRSPLFLAWQGPVHTKSVELLLRTAALPFKPSADWVCGSLVGTPRQAQPLVDCGLFVVLYVQVICACLAEQADVSLEDAAGHMKFTQADMPRLRVAMANALRSSQLIDLSVLQKQH
jgi:hypothetical protein